MRRVAQSLYFCVIWMGLGDGEDAAVLMLLYACVRTALRGHAALTLWSGRFSLFLFLVYTVVVLKDRCPSSQNGTVVVGLVSIMTIL